MAHASGGPAVPRTSSSQAMDNFVDVEAILAGRLTAIQAQLLKSANPDLNSDGSSLTPLLVASHFGYAAIVEMLLDHGASPHLKDVHVQDVVM